MTDPKGRADTSAQVIRERQTPVGSSEPGGRRKDILPRTADFADRVIRLSLALQNHVAGREIARQLIRAGMSVGANVEEAQAGESTADFLHKMRIARKECRETRYFLIRIANAEFMPRKKLEPIIGEAEQVVRILTAIIRSTGS